MNTLIDKSYRTSVTIEDAMRIAQEVISEDDANFPGVANLLHRLFYTQVDGFDLTEISLRYFLLQDVKE